MSNADVATDVQGALKDALYHLNEAENYIEGAMSEAENYSEDEGDTDDLWEFIRAIANEDIDGCPEELERQARSLMRNAGR